MTYYSESLKKATGVPVTLALNVFCAVPECNVLMRVGESAYKIDGATFKHINCPGGAPKHTAAHKYPDTGIHLD